MKQILGITGSVRKLGNSEILVKEVARNIPESHELTLLRMSEFDLRPCRGCYQCLFGKERCIIDDDLYRVIDAIVAADGLIVAAPTYFLGVSCHLRKLTDRGMTLFPFLDALWGKPAVGIVTAGIPGREGAALLGVENFIKMLLVDLKAADVFYGALPGEALLNGDNRDRAATMGKALFGPAPAPPQPCCRLCGGQTFRFLGDNRVRCMLCSNDGTISMGRNIVTVDIEKRNHELLHTRRNVQDHRAWLVGMKERFMEMRHQLKTVCMDYRKDGQWIRPVDK